MAWCDVVEPRTLRDCRIALGQSQAAFAAMLGASPESYRTWDAGRRATVTARRLELPGVVVEQVPTRYYPSAALASHSFGYVGEITDDQLQVTGDDRLRSGSIVGRSGLEEEYNELLMGQDGARLVVVNNTGREVEMISEVPPGAGRQLQLTLDYDLQAASTGNGRSAWSSRCAASARARASIFSGRGVERDGGTGVARALECVLARAPRPAPARRHG